MRTRRRLATAALAALLPGAAVAACGDGSGASSGDPTTAPSAESLDGRTFVSTSLTETPDASLVGPTWRLETILDGETASSVPATVTAVLLFEPGGQVVGSNGCNGFGGPYRATDATLTFGDIFQTLIGCLDEKASVETRVMAVIEGEVAYTIDRDTLTLTDDAGGGLVYRAEAP